ncbi:cobyrinic acid a,c-diamide synthase [Duganella sp. Leaf126]|uniref:cobyrinate a,c-diamide synthase n=1 Tax=Duganella sp. Leaf126 TaxID=1736266 RepID=UPI0006F5226E|nr:cobyrinate a,c-diamide synthase [Duganella sp. Leaf126]KQQ42422.1 cobyrinic acid a,c-diamide synthase [Duganella sp. Leaf126]
MVTPVSHLDVKVVMVAAVSSGQGKTTCTAALARKLVKLGKRVRVFKCGPDFIDPMLLERASGAPVHTLDLWMVGPDLCRSQLAHAALEADVILIEGVMGLYDGTPSSADVARTFGVPVLAVIDASAMAQTAGAIVMGLRDYGAVNMAGVIANRVASANHGKMVAASLRGVPLFATMPRQQASLPERHLGLVVPGEIHNLDTVLDQLADQLQFDQAAWETLAPVRIELPAAAPSALPKPLQGATIAIARDAAFTFLYPANLDQLRALGATLTYFSPLADEPVPAAASAVYLPGGYPELHAPTLSRAAQWRNSIRAAHAAGMPIVAECGGMMALADTLTDQQGAAWPMAGLLPGAVTMQARLAGLGPQGLPTPDGILRGHTFHYSTLSTPVTPVAHTIKHPSAIEGEAWYRVGALTASYFHAYYPSNPAAAAALFMRRQG